jgi:hypothetical protein
MHHDIAEILLKLALNTNQSINLYILFLADRTYSLLSNHLITVKAIKKSVGILHSGKENFIRNIKKSHQKGNLA